MESMKGKLIFDNTGGLTVQLPGFAHHYQDMTQAAGDVADYIKDCDTNGWEGHEEDAAELDPTDEQIRNGGYRVIYLDDIINMTKEELNTWGNIQDFCEALKDLIE